MKVEWKELAIIFGAGAVGGLAGWLIGVVTTNDLGTRWMLDMLTSILCGGLAAGVAIYLIANTNTAQAMRCMFFAVVCGMSWKPVLQAGMKVADTAVTHQEVSDQKSQLQATINNASANGTAPATLLAGASSLADNLNKVESADLQQAAVATASEAVTKAAQAPDVAPEAIAKIAHKAEALNLPALRMAAKAALESLSTKGDVKPETRDKALQLRKDL